MISSVRPGVQQFLVEALKSAMAAMHAALQTSPGSHSAFRSCSFFKGSTSQVGGGAGGGAEDGFGTKLGAEEALAAAEGAGLREGGALGGAPVEGLDEGLDEEPDDGLADAGSGEVLAEEPVDGLADAGGLEGEVLAEEPVDGLADAGALDGELLGEVPGATSHIEAAGGQVRSPVNPAAVIFPPATGQGTKLLLIWISSTPLLQRWG